MVEITEITLESGVNAWDSICEHPRRVTGRLKSTRMLRPGQYLNLGSCRSLFWQGRQLHGRALVIEMQNDVWGDSIEYTGTFSIDQKRLTVGLSREAEQQEVAPVNYPPWEDGYIDCDEEPDIANPHCGECGETVVYESSYCHKCGHEFGDW